MRRLRSSLLRNARPVSPLSLARATVEVRLLEGDKVLRTLTVKAPDLYYQHWDPVHSHDVQTVKKMVSEARLGRRNGLDLVVEITKNGYKVPKKEWLRAIAELEGDRNRFHHQHLRDEKKVKVGELWRNLLLPCDPTLMSRFDGCSWEFDEQEGALAWSNPRLTQVYEDRKKGFVDKGVDPNETTLFHGTTEESIRKIMEQGFTLGRPECAFGSGIYLGKEHKAQDFIRAARYWRSRKFYFLLEVKVLLGCSHEEKVTRYSITDGYKGTVAQKIRSLGYDSLYYDGFQNPEWVVYDPSQVLLTKIKIIRRY